MKQSHLATAAFWIGLLTLFGWQASAQIPRPPMPIPVAVTPAPRPPASIPVNLMPATVPLLRSSPTPIPPPAPERPAPIPAMMPILPQVALPPGEFDRP